MLKNRVKLLGIYINDIDIEKATALARASLSGKKTRIFFTPNLEMLASAQKSNKIRELLNSSSLNLCDGAGVILVFKIMGIPIKNKVAGIDFGEKLLSLACKERAKVFLLGGKRGVAKKAKVEIMKKYPEIEICGTHHGYFEACENKSICDEINRANADILIVCRGFPLQERFVVENIKSLQSIKVVACLGGALDVWSGRVKRAPEQIRTLNLEWLWRILNEPERIKRFLPSLSALFYAYWN